MPGFAPVDPKQSFPDLERGVLERWREQDLFARSLAERADAPIWSFYEGPPTANGRPGSHHVLARVFKDIYPRYRTMCGYRVPRKAGWDCHGLPVELEVEKQLGISSKAEIEEFGIAEFNQRCRESVFEYVEEWDRLTERIGFWVDLDDPYVTLQDRYIESVWWSLNQLFEKGRLYEGHKVVPYCPRDGTPLSSHEVAQGYQDVEDASIYVRFPLLGDDGAPSGESLLVWTTTPWTLPGNVAVAVAPDVHYARAELDGEVLIVAAPLVEKVLGDGAKVLDTIKGADLVGRRYDGPVFELGDGGPTGTADSPAFRLIAGDFVTTDDGTGLVHIAPPFGEDDYLVGAAAGLFDPTVAGTLYNPVRPDGTFDDRVIGFGGEFVKGSETTRRLIDQLSAHGLLFREQPYEHSYPHCWRCGTPLIYYATSSWYVATSAVKDELLANNETIGWHPEHVKHGRFGKWLENNVDWALSRNRYWGTPLPIWRCDDDGCEAVTCIGSVAELKERSGGEAPDDLHRPYIDAVTLRCEDCGGAMHRVSSVIDTWYDSGAMPFAQFHYPFEGKEEFEERFPADYICEAQDQTRGWFYTLLAESTLLFGESSFKNCVCLGLILDPEGQKMSKSRGNVVDPWDVLSAHGADAFRWYYLTTQQPWSGYRFSLETVGESVRTFMLQLWNTYSFWVLYANAEGVEPETISEEAAATDLDRWALSRLQATVAAVRERMDDFDATTAGRAIADFVEELSNWYVRLSRQRFWDGDAAAFATLRTCLIETATMLAPFTPFLADEIYRNLQGGAAGEFGEAADSVHLRDFPTVDEDRRDPDLEAAMAAVRRTVSLGHAARGTAKVKVRQPLRRAVIVATDAERAGIESFTDLVTAELNVKELDFVSDAGDLVTYEVKPNYRALGPRFGKRMPQVAAAVAALDAAHVARTLADSGEIGVSIDGTDHTLGPDDVTMALRPLEGYEVEAEAGHAVALELEIDEELRREGLAREIVRAVQLARKDAGFEITDRIALGLGGDDELVEIAREHEAYIAGETLTENFLPGDGSIAVAAWSPDPDVGGASHDSVTTIEGRELQIAVVPV